MTTTNHELAARVQQIAKASGGLRRQAANCCIIALTYSPSGKAARDALREISPPDVRKSAQ